MLHSTPRMTASPKGMDTFVTAVATRGSYQAPKAPPYTASAAMSREPAKLPMYTTAQARSICPGVMRFSHREMTIRLLPVKSSLPTMTTMASPAGKIHAPASFPAAAEPMDEAAPAKAMNAPASTASRNIRPLGIVALLYPVST